MQPLLSHISYEKLLFNNYLSFALTQFFGRTHAEISEAEQTTITRQRYRESIRMRKKALEYPELEGMHKDC